MVHSEEVVYIRDKSQHDSMFCPKNNPKVFYARHSLQIQSHSSIARNLSEPTKLRIEQYDNGEQRNQLGLERHSASEANLTRRGGIPQARGGAATA